MLRLSFSSISLYMKCPRAYWFRYLAKPKPPKRIDLPRLFGGVVHQHVRRIEKRPKEPRRFYFREMKGAVNQAYMWWGEALEQTDDSLILASDEQITEYNKLLAICISHYWKISEPGPPPLPPVERTYTHVWSPGVTLTGTIDQIRPASVEKIALIRPELVDGGELRDGYDPVWLVDLKTNRRPFSPYQEKGSEAKWVRLQYELHAYLQPTVYTWLYEQTHGKKPAGFIWWHLRSGKRYYTYREEADYVDLRQVIDHVVANLNAQSFPKHVGALCQFCDYISPCRPGPFLISLPEMQTAAPIELVPNPVIQRDPVQLRLKLKVPRQPKKLELEVFPIPMDQIVYIGGEPWDETV